VSHRIKSGDIIDSHVHFGGPPRENESKYFWSQKFIQSTTFDAIKLAVRMSAGQMSGLRYLQVLLNQIQQSKHIDKIVLLALDKFYSEDGHALDEKTHLYVNNSFLMHLSFMYHEFLFGCSVHPYAPDAVNRLWH